MHGMPTYATTALLAFIRLQVPLHSLKQPKAANHQGVDVALPAMDLQLQRSMPMK
jgi:hypothetical protein